MALVVRGLLNKQVGGELGISEMTVKAHRGNVMRKMEADSLAELVNMAARLHLASIPLFRSSNHTPAYFQYDESISTNVQLFLTPYI